MLVQCIEGHSMYPVPQVHLATFKKELDHLVEIIVLSPIRDTEWGLPTFITTKKYGTVRLVSDLRGLNKVLLSQENSVYLINYHRRLKKKRRLCMNS